MVLALHEETYQCVKEIYGHYFPKTEMCTYDTSNELDYYKIVDEGVERVEMDYSKIYRKDVILTPRTPNIYNTDGSHILIELSEGNPHDIRLTSQIVIGNSSSTFARIYEFGIDYFGIDERIDFAIGEEIFLTNKVLRESHINFIMIYDIVKKGTNLVECSINISMHLDNPVYYNEHNYVNHDNIGLTYCSKYGYTPCYIPSCICHLELLGSDRCSLKKYLSTKSIGDYKYEFKKYLDDNQHKIGHQVYCDMCVVFSNLGYEYPTNFNKLSDQMFDIKDKISDGEYLNMMDILMKIKNYY